MQNTISAGAKFDFGTVIFSEQDIIDFAEKNDPLLFHTDKLMAKNHLFKDIVASGQHPFHHYYVLHWIPMFGKTVLCGLSVNNWTFQKPLYAGMELKAIVSVKDLKQHPEKKSVSITWKFDFLDSKNTHFQHLEMSVLHTDLILG